MALAPSRIVRAPRGSELSAKSWQTEAPLRMLMNNLDPEVAERPDDQVRVVLLPAAEIACLDGQDDAPGIAARCSSSDGAAGIFPVFR